MNVRAKLHLTTYSLLASLCSSALAANYFTVGPYAGGQHAAYNVFEKYVEVFGVGIYADQNVDDADVLHAANMMAQYLDNDADGIPDNPDIMNVMTNTRPAHLIMFKNENQHNNSGFDDNVPDSWWDSHTLQTFYGNESFPQGSGTWGFDGGIEEVLHLITSGGFHYARPSVLGEDPGTVLSAAMAEAKAGNYYNPEANEPGLPHIIQVSEYFFFALTSILGAQSYPGRLQEIQDEWSLNTTTKVQQFNPAGYALMTDPAQNLPTILPDGNYQPNPAPVLQDSNATWSNGALTISWSGDANTRLQETESITTPSWLDIAGSQGQSFIAPTLASTQGFYRIVHVQ